jgi:hypothetical protein
MQNMEMKDFIADAIVQINEGIRLAIGRLEADGKRAKVNPLPQGIKDWSHYERSLEFDIAVTAISGAAAGGKLNLVVLGFSAGVDARHEATSVHRLKFSLPVVFEGQPIEGPVRT